MNVARVILVVCPGLDEEPSRGGFDTEDRLDTGAALSSDCGHLDDAAIRVHCHHRHDPTVREEDVLKRCVGIEEDLFALATDLLKPLA